MTASSFGLYFISNSIFSLWTFDNLLEQSQTLNPNDNLSLNDNLNQNSTLNNSKIEKNQFPINTDKLQDPLIKANPYHLGLFQVTESAGRLSSYVFKTTAPTHLPPKPVSIVSITFSNIPENQNHDIPIQNNFNTIEQQKYQELQIKKGKNVRIALADGSTGAIVMDGNGTIVGALVGHTHPITLIQKVDREGLIATCSKESVYIWNILDCEPIALLLLPQNSGNVVAFSSITISNDLFILTGSEDGYLRMWNLDRRIALWEYKLQNSIIPEVIHMTNTAINIAGKGNLDSFSHVKFIF